MALLNYAFWERRFGKDPSVIGKSFRLADKPVTVIGVMPPGLTFPTPRVDLWIQIVPDRDRPLFFWFAFGRLADGAARKTAQAEMDTIASRVSQTKMFLHVCGVLESSFGVRTQWRFIARYGELSDSCF